MTRSRHVSVRIVLTGLIALVGLPGAGATAAAGQPAPPRELLWQTHAGGDDVHVIDIRTRQTIQRIVVGPNPHGIAAPADRSVVFVSLERNGEDRGELLWIDPATFSIQRRIRVGREPHAIAVTPDGRWVYVPCRDGHYWVVDARRGRVVERIRTGGRPHNTTSSPDGRYMYLSPMGEPERVTVVDVGAGHEVVGQIPFGASVRPPALSADGDLLFQHVDGLNGFKVADLRDREVVATVKHSRSLGWILLPIKKLGWLGPHGLNRCHGLAVRPGSAEVWSACGEWVTVHRIEEDGYPEIDSIDMPDDAYWLTFSPDGRYAFVAITQRDAVAMVDARTREAVEMLEVGDGPKRNLVLRIAP